MSNLSIFDRNVIHALAGVAETGEALDAAETTYLRGRERDRLAAELAALDVASVYRRVTLMLEASAATYRSFGHSTPDATAGEVRAFAIERAYRRHIPQN